MERQPGRLRTDGRDLSRSLPRQERENLGHQRQSFIKLLARTKSNRAWNVRKSPRAMPEADNLNLFPVVSQPVNDTVGTADDFAQVWLTEFRHHASDEHTSELQSRQYLVCRLLLEK